MEMTIFIAASLIEVGLAAYSILTKSDQPGARTLTRIGTLAVFGLCTLAAVIEWGTRYYALAALLFLLAVIAAANLHTNKERKPYNAARIVGRALGMIVLLFAASLPAILFPQHRPIETTGEYQVATINFTYTDTARLETYTISGENRWLNVQFWYPEGAAGTYPLVVFSHGSMGIKTSNESLYNELASHGYVVCAIDHTYQALYTKDASGKRIRIDQGFMQELQREDAHTNKQQSFAYYQKWMGIRTADIDFVIDTILAQAQKEDAETVYRLIDSEKIGVMGHSLGGSAALAMGRMRQDVRAVIALESPFMGDIVGVKDGAFVWNKEPYPVPVLNIYSDSAWEHLDEWAQYAENAALLSETGATAFNVHISGVGHLGLTDLSMSSPFLTRLLDGHPPTTAPEDGLKTINQICLDFFDSYLKDEGEFTAAVSN
jgi:dienelactone hydrolase